MAYTFLIFFKPHCRELQLISILFSYFFLAANNNNFGFFKCYKARTAIKKIELKYKTKFEFGSASHKLYEAAGSSEDWTRLSANIPYTYVIELRPLADDHLHPNPNLGFDFPENKVKSSAEEIYYGIKEYLINFNQKNYDKSIIQACSRELNFMVRASGHAHREYPES